MEKHIIVVSIDAMVLEDLEYCRTLPAFSEILKDAALIERVQTIYPSLTHPVHGTLITGAAAGKTGAVNNSVFHPEVPERVDEWYNYLHQLRCETIFHAAKRAGLRSATTTWPMASGGQEVIDYLVPCVLTPDLKGYEHCPVEAYRALGAQKEITDIIGQAIARYGYENTYPAIDERQIYCAVELIKRYRPHLLFTHPVCVDHARHVSGVFGPEVRPALEQVDKYLQRLLAAVREAGIAEQTSFVLLSDHGQINITRTVSPNVRLCEEGYITSDAQGRPTAFRAYVKSAGASAHVYLSDPADKALYGAVYRLLSQMAQEGTHGFERVYTTNEVCEKYGLYGDFSFVLETDGQTGFGEWLQAPAVRGFDLSDYRFGRGTHGHEPCKGAQPFFVAKGPSFRAGVTLAQGSILNHAPTLAAALGLSLPQAEGHPVWEILAEQ